jgi:pimeloyl-ACP methyl ester carboxylesterase
MPEEIFTPGLATVEHMFEVPLDHDDPTGPKVGVFAREVADPDGRDRPFLVYLQGGPGFEAPRATRVPSAPAWLDRALQEFRVLMLDQRGTGRSAPVGALADLAPPEQAEYLAHFRADSIVRDAEWIRRELDVERWSVLGQSFGGLCVATYLSIAPEGLSEALITGGLPPLRRSIDEIYARTYQRVLERHERVEDDGVVLPSGEHLTWRRVRQLGLLLGMNGGPERLHHLLELPLDSPAFLHDLEASAEFGRNPLYAILHEACWADGGATRWSAQRMLPAEFEAPHLLTGEHVFPWMFEDYAALRPLRQAASLLAQRDWPYLYDPEALAANEVPAAAVIYAEDMYVERSFSEHTAAQIKGLRPWVTNEYDHNGLRVDGERILGRLLDLARGRA